MKKKLSEKKNFKKKWVKKFANFFFPIFLFSKFFFSLKFFSIVTRGDGVVVWCLWSICLVTFSINQVWLPHGYFAIPPRFVMICVIFFYSLASKPVCVLMLAIFGVIMKNMVGVATSWPVALSTYTILRKISCF